MKVFLVERGGPFSSRRADAGRHIAEKGMSPLLALDKAKALPPASSGWQQHYDVCVLPGELYLEALELSRRIPVIAYGGADMAFSCFEAGCADFMCEGWTRLELEARLYRFWQPSIACADGLFSIRATRLEWESGRGDHAQFVELSPGEVKTLRRLFAIPGQIITGDFLLGEYSSVKAGSRALSMRMSRLKSKLSGLCPGLGENIVSARGAGYLWISR